MLLEEGAEEEGKVLDEVLLVFLPILVGISNVRAQGKHLKGESCTFQLLPPPFFPEMWLCIRT